MKTLTEIFVTGTVEGIHFFRGAGEKEEMEDVGYLQYPHRHMFNFKVELEVTHDDRDVEFLQLKHMVIGFLREEYYCEKLQLLNFEGRSCEMLSREIAENLVKNKFNVKRVSMDEDGENGATIQVLNENPSKENPKKTPEKPNVLFVVGKTGSGKSYISEILGRPFGVKVVEVSDIIKTKNNIISGVKSDQVRRELQKGVTSDELAVVLIDLIRYGSEAEGEKNLIINGLRDYRTFLLVKNILKDKVNFSVTAVVANDVMLAMRTDSEGIQDYRDRFEQIDMDLGVHKIMEEADHVINNN